jgi:hypothetical protein
MASITITNITFSSIPAGNQTVAIYYRLATSADVSGSYTLVTSSQLVRPDGVLIDGSDTPTPLIIPSLSDGTDYIVKVVPACGGDTFYVNFRTPPELDLSCGLACCSWSTTNNTTQPEDVLYIDAAYNLVTLTVVAGETKTFQGSGIINIPPGFTLTSATPCTTSTTTTTTIAPLIPITGQIRINCTDDNCSHQGDTVFTVSLSRTFSFPITLLIGQILDYGGPPINPDLRYPYMGYNLYSEPTGQGYYRHPYYDNPNAMGSQTPFKVVIPANTLNYTAPIPVGQDGFDPTNGWGRWVCNHCSWKIKDLYVKVNNAGYIANFSMSSTGNQYTYTTVHNV